MDKNLKFKKNVKLEDATVRIERTKYLQELIDRKHNGLVKVITGIRRCGKSYLLFTLFYDHLIAEGGKKENIITLELDQTENIRYRNPLEVDQYLRSLIRDNGEMH